MASQVLKFRKKSVQKLRIYYTWELLIIFYTPLSSIFPKKKPVNIKHNYIQKLQLYFGTTVGLSIHGRTFDLKREEKRTFS